MLSLLFILNGLFAQTPNLYDCQLILVAGDAPGGVGEAKFTVPGPLTATHGGPERTFTFGPNEVTVQAHARWRAITWRRGQNVVVASITASATDLLASTVHLAMNPEKTDESAALECSPR